MMSTEGSQEKTVAALSESRRRLFEARDLALGGLFGALAIVIPIAFHALGGGLGSLFLPMYYPILALGLLASWEVALLVGILAPVLSMVFTGMPPPPVAVIMVFELATIGAVASLLRHWRLGIWPSSLTALIASRVVGIGGVVAILPLIGIHRGIYEYAIAGSVASLPGIVILLTVVPAAVYAIERTSMIGRRQSPMPTESE